MPVIGFVIGEETALFGWIGSLSAVVSLFGKSWSSCRTVDLRKLGAKWAYRWVIMGFLCRISACTAPLYSEALRGYNHIII